MRNRLSHISPNFILLVTMAMLLALAIANRFVSDDAFISFRYAQHLAEGYGLVWNIGDVPPVEGYTNFLWTVLISLGFVLSIEPTLFSWLLGLLCFIGTLVFTYHIARDLTDNPYWGIIAIILVGANYTFSAFVTGGLETQLKAMLILAGIYATHRVTSAKFIKPHYLVLISLIFSALLMTRLDAGIFVAILGLSLTYHIMRQSETTLSTKVQFIAMLSIPMLLIVGAWLLWKLDFYGNILPNTFYAKVGSKPFIYARGLIYLIGFWLSYWLFPFPIMIGWGVIKGKFSQLEKQLILMIVIWTAYLLYVGGDHIEFRFMTPIIPLLMILIVSILAWFIHRQAVQIGLILIVIGGSVSHALTYDQSPFNTHQHSLPLMLDQPNNPNGDWDGIGQRLGEAFDYDRSVTIALNPVGFIPYYSRARTIDMLGLNDIWVAHNGIPYLTLAAHEKITTFDYLLSQEVNLLIDHPKMIPLANQEAYTIDSLNRFHVKIEPDDLPEDAVFLEIPINETRKLLTLYLFPHPAIDKAIETYGWETYSIDPVS